MNPETRSRSVPQERDQVADPHHKHRKRDPWGVRRVDVEIDERERERELLAGLLV
jgi:hypothetical protein